MSPPFITSLTDRPLRSWFLLILHQTFLILPKSMSSVKFDVFKMSNIIPNEFEGEVLRPKRLKGEITGPQPEESSRHYSIAYKTLKECEMSKIKVPLVALLVIQVVAFLVYPPAYFQRAPQAAVLPPTLLILFAAALIGLNSGVLSAENTRNSLVFVQGINVVVRMMTLFPNLKTPEGEWAWALLVTQLMGIALSWYAMVAMENLSMRGFIGKKDTPDTTRDAQSIG